jgi:CheY-like chemotaxis protein
MRILFADDNADTRNMFRLVFEISGHMVRTAADGSEAVEMGEEKKTSMSVFSMWKMPVLNGLEALKMIREKILLFPSRL